MSEHQHLSRAALAVNLGDLLADAQPTISRQGDLILLDCPDGTITDYLYDALEALSYASGDRSPKGEDA